MKGNWGVNLELHLKELKLDTLGDWGAHQLLTARAVITGLAFPDTHEAVWHQALLEFIPTYSYFKKRKFSLLLHLC